MSPRIRPRVTIIVGRRRLQGASETAATPGPGERAKTNMAAGKASRIE
jgi:hypothetical protein